MPRQPVHTGLLAIPYTIQACSCCGRHSCTQALLLFCCFPQASDQISLIQFSAPPQSLAFPKTSSLDFIPYLPYYTTHGLSFCLPPHWNGNVMGFCLFKYLLTAICLYLQYGEAFDAHYRECSCLDNLTILPLSRKTSQNYCFFVI